MFRSIDVGDLLERLGRWGIQVRMSPWKLEYLSVIPHLPASAPCACKLVGHALPILRAATPQRYHSSFDTDAPLTSAMFFMHIDYTASSTVPYSPSTLSSTWLITASNRHMGTAKSRSRRLSPDHRHLVSLNVQRPSLSSRATFSLQASPLLSSYSPSSFPTLPSAPNKPLPPPAASMRPLPSTLRDRSPFCGCYRVC